MLQPQKNPYIVLREDGSAILVSSIRTGGRNKEIKCDNEAEASAACAAWEQELLDKAK